MLFHTNQYSLTRKWKVTSWPPPHHSPGEPKGWKLMLKTNSSEGGPHAWGSLMSYKILGKIYKMGQFWKKVFFNFLGPFDIFWTPKPCLVSETSLLGGHTSNILWSKQRFRSWKFHVLAPQFSKPNWFIIWNWFHNHYHSGDECCVAFTWNRKRWFPGLEVSQTFTQWLYNENKYFHFNRKVK